MTWLINKGRKRSPVKKGTLLDVVLYTEFSTYTGDCKQYLKLNNNMYCVLNGAAAGTNINMWERSHELEQGQILLWREHSEESNTDVPPELLSEALKCK